MKNAVKILSRDNLRKELSGTHLQPSRIAPGITYLEKRGIASLSRITDAMIIDFRRRQILSGKGHVNSLEILRNWFYKKEAEALLALTDLPKNEATRRICAYLSAHGISRPEEITYTLREDFVHYLRAISYKDERGFLRFFDRIKLYGIKTQEEDPWHTGSIKTVPEKLFLLYYPSFAPVRILYKTRWREDLVLAFTKLATDTIRRQFLFMVNYEMQHMEGSRYHFSERRIHALKDLFDTASLEKWEDIRLLLKEDERKHYARLCKKHGLSADVHMQELYRMQELLFVENGHIHWEAMNWYIQKIPVDSYRTNPSDLVGRLSFSTIRRAGNRTLFQEYIKYLIGNTDTAMLYVRGQFYKVRDLMAFCDRQGVDIADLSAEEFEVFLLEIEIDKPLDASTFNRMLFFLQRFFNFLTVRGHIKDAPCNLSLYKRKEYKKHLDRCVPEDIQDKTLSALIHFPMTLRLMYLHLWALGLRINEVCTIKADSYFQKDDTCWIRIYQHKMRTEKVIPIPSMLYELTMGYIKEQKRKPKDYVFQRKNGGAYSSQTFQVQMKRLCDKYGINTASYTFRSHDFRHTIATSCHKSGMTISGIRDYLGHRYSDMTKQYIDYIPKEIRNKNEAYFKENRLMEE